MGRHRDLLDLFAELYERAGRPSWRSVAGAAKISPSYLSEVLNGKNIPSEAVTVAITRTLGGTADERRRAREHAAAAVADRARTLRDRTDYDHGGAEGTLAVGRGGEPARWLQSGYVTPRLVRSVYMEQVRRIAPPRLLDRDTELGELAAFCLQEGRGPYVWWQAGPWAGKSALLSTFVLNPPPELAERVWLVSFFITARLAAQDTRDAFVTFLTEQLCTLTGQDLPTTASEVTREAVLLDVLTQAATACQHAGRRLVLVVDGLDEDSGVTTGPHAHSIAALLPAQPQAGMRIIVAGRPNPPVPDDVPPWHPLRSPGIIRLLSDSPHARDLEHAGKTELKRLLGGSDLDRDVVGLLTAAGGGLSSSDLSELLDADPLDIEAVLNTVAGRTFTHRPSIWSDHSFDVYLLGHEELQQAAIYYLGRKLGAYRDRIYAWADTYQVPSPNGPAWPEHTPVYLLTGYPRMLTAAGDLGRLVLLATDPARHDRMLDTTGGDAAALAEIATTQTLNSAQPRPDLAIALRLAWHRNHLADRNTNIPSRLPAVWAALGQPIRAETLARSITDPDRQTQALASLAWAVADAGEYERAEQIARSITNRYEQARALASLVRAVAGAGEYERAEQIARSITNPDWQAHALTGLARAATDAGEHERARTLVTDAEQIARSITNPDWQAHVLTGLARAVADAGEHERAEQIARSITNRYEQARALTGLARAVADAGEHERAEQIARSITNRYEQAPALTDLVRAAADAGEHERARTLVTDAEQIARSITNRYEQAQALAGLVRAVADAGEHERAEQIARSITNWYEQARALADLVRAVADAGEHERAEQIARSITNPDEQAHALTDVARAAADAGEHERARTLATDAEQIARSITNPARHAHALAGLVRAVADAGEHERAEQIARSITYPDRQARALTDLARAVADAGEHERAEQIARSITNRYGQARALTDVARAVADAGEYERAEQIARSITNPDEQAHALTDLARAAADAGEHERARTLATDAEQIARSITNPARHAYALADLARAAAGAGEHERVRTLVTDAEQIARSITDPDGQARVLAGLARAAAGAGEYERAEQIARSITYPNEQEHALADLVRAVADAGEHERAEQIARSITNGYGQARALAGLVRAVADAGEHERAEQIARSITNPNEQAHALTDVARAVADAGEHERAEQIARSIADPDEQAHALTGLAAICEPTIARSLSVAALAVGQWTIPLTMVGRLDAKALSDFVDEYILRQPRPVPPGNGPLSGTSAAT
ncbi:hypothetical protein AB0H83_49135 [Dactylosporangium sp. NPDC050688]|uniref:hypothetical protein n=1 Tax=Dactylosporangium sp. NPDC050688 TaxID=3157217 RepID=UPI0033F745F8